MDMDGKLFRLAYHALSFRSARAVLVGRRRCPQRAERGRFTRRDADSIMEETWRNFDVLLADLASDRGDLAPVAETWGRWEKAKAGPAEVDAEMLDRQRDNRRPPSDETEAPPVLPMLWIEHD